MENESTVTSEAPAVTEASAPDALLDVTGTVAATTTGHPGLDLLADIGRAVSDEQASARARTAAIIKGLRRGGILCAFTAMFYWVVFSPPVAMNSFYNHVLFVPTRGQTQARTIAGLPIERVTFTAVDGKKLTGWYVQNPGATKTILFNHGNGGNMDAFVPIMENAVQAGASLFAYDYRGYGASEGEPSLDGVIDDAQAAYDYLVQSKHVPKENIVFYGVSLGTGVAMQLLERRPAAAVILMSPYTNIIAVAREHLVWLNLYPDFAFPKQHLDTKAALEKAHPPVLVIHGDMDRTVLFHHALDLQKSSAKPVEFVFVPKAGHNDLIDVAPVEIRSAIEKYVK